MKHTTMTLSVSPKKDYSDMTRDDLILNYEHIESLLKKKQKKSYYEGVLEGFLICSSVSILLAVVLM